MNKKYSIYDKKKLMYNIKKINQKDLYYKIYDIVSDEIIEYTTNTNGIFFDFNKLSNDGLSKIEDFVQLYDEDNNTSSIEYVKYSTEDFNKINTKGSRLNNIEKQFLKFNKVT
tara:strand:- start:1012 stop:1350 length:339 start_codon:yes stop_codon:yes gene_type:complete